MHNLWHRISHVGVAKRDEYSDKEIKRMVFFNQVLVVGFFGVALQLIMVWPFLKKQSLIFLCAPLLSLISVIFNSKGWFNFSKWFFIFSMYALGAVTAVMLGGSGLYHLGVFSTFTFGLILYNSKKDLIFVLLGFLFMVFILAIGEMQLFNAPDFSNVSWTRTFRWANISSLVLVNSILVNFILKLNKKTESELSTTVSQKEIILHQVRLQASQLENQKKSLEEAVIQRTKEVVQQRDELKRQNRDKEILLQEVHHRVKNNLQIIISLINLQRKKEIHTETEFALRDIQTRISSMAIVHLNMYENTNFSNINLRNYCNNMVESASALYTDQKIIFKEEIPGSINIDMNKAIPMGLILNEILGNFFKHGFDPERDGNTFSLKVIPNKKTYEFVCTDNGTGFPDLNEIKETNSIGLEIIEGLVDQLDGEFKYYNSPGATYQFTMLK